MSLSLIAQAVTHQLRQRLAPPASAWTSRSLADHMLSGLEGDIRVADDTIIVTYYNASQADHLQNIYADLPAKLAAEKIDPRIPWLYGFKLDFRFR